LNIPKFRDQFKRMETITYKLNLTSTITALLCLFYITINAQTVKPTVVTKDTTISPVKQLHDVKITGTRPIIKQEADHIVYDLQLDPESKGNSVFGMIPKIPFLTLDGANNMLLKGKSDYKIFINGRPSSMLERNPTEILRSMPASSIQKIEVITNPSSKYDAEGLAGIINIVTTRAIIDGYNGSLNLNTQFPTGGPGLGGAFNIKSGKLGIATYAGAATSRNPGIESSSARTSAGINAITLVQNGQAKSNSRSGYMGTEISYEIDSLNLLSTQLNLNGSSSDGTVTQLSRLFGTSGQNQRYSFTNNNTTKGSGWDAGLNYQLGFKRNKNKLLTFSYRYYQFDNTLNSDVLFYDRLNMSTPDYSQHNVDQYAEQTAQVDYTQQFKGLTLEAGLKGIQRNNDGNSANTSGDDNLFTNTQYVLGAYNSYSFTLKNWGVKAGLRLEETIVNADFLSNASEAHQRYFNLIPSVSLFRKLSAQSSINMGFSQRIKRPGINKLNPFVNRSNPGFETSGNPDLKPSLINAVQIGYSSTKKLSLNVAMDYSFVNNIFIQIAEYNAQTQVTRTTFQNIGKTSGLSANLNISYPLTKIWNMNINGNGGYLCLEAFSNNRPIKVNMFTYNATLSSNYTVADSWRLNASATAVSRNLTTLQGRSNGFIRSSFSLNKDIIKNQLSFAAAVNNPFQRYRENRIETIDVSFFQTNLSRENFRNYSFSLNYKFGKLKEALKKTKRGIKNDDLSN